MLWAQVIGVRVRLRHIQKVSHPIDFVIPWVDGSDPEWLKEYSRYSSEPGDSSAKRFRDWDLLRYWFRGVEQFAPWVNRVFFVTWGHVPAWLNTSHPKLEVVRHEDYIPQRFLPTFSSHTIELNLHRIKGLSEHFVYFNDDMYLLRPVEESYFFKKGLPCGTAVMQPCAASKTTWFFEPFANVAVLNEHFDTRKSILRHLPKWVNPKYGTMALRTTLMLPYRRFYGFYQFHMPSALLKSAFVDVWREEGDILEGTCRHRFRVNTDVNQWLVLWWQFGQGKFVPQSSKGCNMFSLEDGVEERLEDIRRFMQQKSSKMICINDCDMTDEQFAMARAELQGLFEAVLPERSAFET